jgi:hypothetical protein
MVSQLKNRRQSIKVSRKRSRRRSRKRSQRRSRKRSQRRSSKRSRRRSSKRSRRRSRKRSRRRSSKRSRRRSRKRSRGGVNKKSSLDDFMRDSRQRNIPAIAGISARAGSPSKRVNQRARAQLQGPIDILGTKYRMRAGKIQEFIRYYLKKNNMSRQEWIEDPETWTPAQRSMLAPLKELTNRMRIQRWAPANIIGFPVFGVNIREWMQENPNANRYV